MSEKVNLICIVCPVGCQLEVTTKEDQYIVTGNTCNRGPEYANNELTNPMRVLTTTVTVHKGKLNRLPVKTNGEIPKRLLFEMMSIINEIVLEAPIKMGDIIIKNVLDTGVDVVAARSLKKLE